MTKVERNRARSRYEIVVDGQVAGVADYRESGTTVVFPHAEICCLDARPATGRQTGAGGLRRRSRHESVRHPSLLVRRTIHPRPSGVSRLALGLTLGSSLADRTLSAPWAMCPHSRSHRAGSATPA